jgi:diaminopimelate epimerase
MRKGEFYKLQASGNDFVLIDARRRNRGEKHDYVKLARQYCRRKFGIGADGLLFMEFSRKASVKMRIFNADGSEAEMCGNGARCAAFWMDIISAGRKNSATRMTLETKAGIIEAEIIDSKLKTSSQSRGKVKIKMTDPFDLRRDLPLKVLTRNIKVNHINTGVPHTVIFVSGLDGIDVENIGRAVRFHERFRPAGTNVDFVEVIGDNRIKIRTYERGVEGETLACGTGIAAAAIITGDKEMGGPQFRPAPGGRLKIKALARSGETLDVYFSAREAPPERSKNRYKDVWLQGEVDLVYRGNINR